ncbi:hypothetical protein SK128_028108, partial [Halocaridina rubra]
MKPYSSRSVELERFGSLRPTQNLYNGIMSGEKIALLAVTFSCMDPSMKRWSSVGNVEEIASIVSRASCCCREGGFALEVGMKKIAGIGSIQGEVHENSLLQK